MKKLHTLLFSFLTIIGIVATPLVTAAVTYADSTDPVSQIQSGFTDVGGTDSSGDDFKTYMKTIVNVMLFILGAIAVIMIVIGGIRYTTSNGDSSQITGAKNTILYAVVGLVVAILAYAIVNFVITSFKK